MDAHVQCTALAERSRAPVPLQTPPPPASYHAQRTQGDAARPPRKRRHGGRRAKRQHRALALAAAIEVTTSEAAPATRGAPGHGCSPDAIEAAALAAALAESALGPRARNTRRCRGSTHHRTSATVAAFTTQTSAPTTTSTTRTAAGSAPNSPPAPPPKKKPHPQDPRAGICSAGLSQNFRRKFLTPRGDTS
jgi:hypothetical protein